MEFKEYQEEAVKMAIYPAEEAIIYPSIGVVDEGLEFLEKCANYYEDKLIRKSELTKEAGDVMWYIANTVCDLEEQLENVAKGIILPMKTEFKDARFAMMVSLQRLIGKTKKRLRGDSGITVEITLDLIKRVYGCLMVILHEENIDINDVLRVNIDKINDRQKRDVLQGDGDDR